MSTEQKWVYNFGGGSSDGDASLKNLLGGKGANLAEMASLGLPVPPGFTITTEVCTLYYKNDRAWPAGLDGMVDDAVNKIGEVVGKVFGDLLITFSPRFLRNTAFQQSDLFAWIGKVF